MQQFTIPQFIDVEDKIIGPVTTRQFIIILAGFLIMAAGYKLFDFSLFIFVSIIVLAICISFAFVRINGRPFHFFALNLVQTVKRPKLRVWRNKIAVKEDYSLNEKPAVKKSVEKRERMAPSMSRLTELSLIVDTKGEYQGDKENSKIISI